MCRLSESETKGQTGWACVGFGKRRDVWTESVSVRKGT